MRVSTFSQTFNPRTSMVAAVGWATTGVLMLLAIAASLWAGAVAHDSLEEIAENRLQNSAWRFSQEFSISLYAYLQEMQTVAKALGKDGSDHSDRRKLLEGLQSLLSHLEWAGYADSSGQVLSATGGVREGYSVVQHPWFSKGLNSLYLGAIHDENVEIGLPVEGADGRLKGVLGARLHWNWIEDLVKRVSQDLAAQHPMELMIVDRNGKVLLGPPAWLGQALTGIAVPTQKSKDESLSARVSAATIHLDTSVWPDGKTYVMRCHASSGFKGIGTRWTICVYESATTAFALAGSVQRHIFAIIVGLGVVAVAIGVRVIYGIMRRLIAVARAADDLRTGATTELHIPAGKDEIARIGQAFNRLVQALQAEQQSLRALNVDLDTRIAARTREVERMAEENKYAAIVRERLRMARELHDTLAHSMAAMLTEIRLLRRLTKTKPALLEDELVRAEEAAHQGLQEARAAIAQIRYNAVRDTGLGPALAMLLARFREEKGIAVDFEVASEATNLADSRAETLFRIAEEIFSNIERHAAAQKVDVSLSIVSAVPTNQPFTSGTLQMTVADDGVGFDPRVIPPGHYGLLGMREQANLIGASLQIESASSSGTRITVSMPL